MQARPYSSAVFSISMVMSLGFVGSDPIITLYKILPKDISVIVF
jgi:hypothetical protein